MTPDQRARLDRYRAATPEVLEALPHDGWGPPDRAERLGQALDHTEDPVAAAITLLSLPHRVWWWNPTAVTRAALRALRLNDPADVGLLVALAHEQAEHCAESAQRLGWILPTLQAALATLGEPARVALVEAVADLDAQGPAGCAAGVRRRAQLVALCGMETGPAQAVPGDDLWAERVREHLGALPPEDRGRALELLAHLDTVPGGPQPSARWRSRTAARLDEPGVALVRWLLEAVPGAAVRQVRVEGAGLAPFREQVLAEPSQQHIKAAVWAAVGTGADWVAPAVTAVAVEAARGTTWGPAVPKVANAAIAALGTLDPEVAMVALGHLETTLRHRSLRTRVRKAAEAVAATTGLALADLAERSVPDHDLGTDSARVVPVGGYTATLAVEPGGRDATLVFARAPGGTLRGVPRAVRTEHAEDLARLRRDRTELQATLAAQRARLEAALATERRWSGADLRRFSLHHPVTGPAARGLIWEVITGDEVRAVLPALDAEAPIPDDASVRLWHPCQHPAAEVQAWRERVVRAEVRQPCKQAFREVYLLTPAEEETRVYSNRFAGHVVRAGQFQALVRARGWTMSGLGSWDGGFEATPTRQLHEVGLVAQLFVEAVEDGGMDERNGMALLAATDQVRFVRLGAAARPVPLVEVPPRTLSEVLRDVDLFVSVSSVAMDPTWADRGADRVHAYWERAAFGELTPAGETRREVLARLLPRLRIADRCTLGPRELVVRGSRRTYRIHLGSANVKMEPNDAYLCIVAAREPAVGTQVFLPFDDDRTLSLVLSKAFLLADDAGITDPTILRQIEQR